MKWRSVFEQSRIYGGVYNGDELPRVFNIRVKDSWFQKRLEYIRQQQKTELMEQAKKRPIPVSTSRAPLKTTIR